MMTIKDIRDLIGGYNEALQPMALKKNNTIPSEINKIRDEIKRWEYILEVIRILVDYAKPEALVRVVQSIDQETLTTISKINYTAADLAYLQK
jgi:hypothetical protein